MAENKLPQKYSINLYQIFKLLKKAYGPQKWWPAESALEVIVGAILTQNTSWKNVERAIANLKKAHMLNIKSLTEINKRSLAGQIKSSGFFNIKASRLKNFMNYLKDEYSGNLKACLSRPIHHLREELLRINGVGQETADCIILYAAGKPSFVIDAYTKRVFLRLGVINARAGYDQIQKYFMSNLELDKALFNEYHALIVEHAKRVCKIAPECGKCSLKTYCRYNSQKWFYKEN